MINILRAGVVGSGLIGSMHARVYRQTFGVTLCAVCDAKPDVAKRLGEELGVPWYDDASRMFEHEKFDVVSIATPEQHRYEPTRIAREQGVALMLEKPLGIDLEETDRLIDLLGGYDHPIAVNFILHADDRYATMREKVRAGDVGRVATYFARRRGTKLGIEKYAPWTDLLLSTAIHDLEFMSAVHAAPVVRVYGEAVSRLCEQYGCEDAVAATLKFADGTIGILETSWTLPPTQPEPLDPAFHVVGDRGGIFIDGSSHGMRIMSEDGYSHPDLTHWPALPLGVGGAFERSLAAFITAVRSGSEPLVGLQQARRAHVLVDAIKKSLAEERPITLPHT